MEILNTFQEAFIPVWATVVGFTLLVIGVVIFVRLLIHDDDDIAALVRTIIGFIVLAAAMTMFCFVRQTKTRIEVQISDDASFKEIAEKYDIVEIRGEIYVLEERETAAK